MYSESQDAEQQQQHQRAQLQRETSCPSSAEARREEKAEDAPHCVTCYCLPSNMKCSRYRQMYERCAEQRSIRTPTDYNAGDYVGLQRCGDETKPSALLSATKLSGGRSRREEATDRRACRKRQTTLDDLLRQMKLEERSYAEERLECSKTEEDELAVAALCPDIERQARRRRRHRPSGAGSYRSRHELAKFAEISTRNASDAGQRWKHEDVIVVPQIDDIATDALANKLPDDDWQQQQYHHRLEDNATLVAVEKDRSQAASEPDEASCNNLLMKEFGGEAHVRELKLVRWDFIERIREEVLKLYRLQRHLDSCSPRVSHTRSVHTMTEDEPGGA